MIIPDAEKRIRNTPSVLDSVFERLRTAYAAAPTRDDSYPATSEGIARLNADGAAFRREVRAPNIDASIESRHHPDTDDFNNTGPSL